MKSPSLKRVLIFATLTVVWYGMFNWVNPRVLTGSIRTPVIIDVRPYKSCKFFDSQYVKDAKKTGYHISKYYEFYLPLDTVFVFIYSCLFLSLARCTRRKNIIRVLTAIIFIGAILDWSENFSFAAYLSSSGDGLATWVSYFTTIKTFFFLSNILLATCCAMFGVVTWLRPAKT